MKEKKIKLEIILLNYQHFKSLTVTEVGGIYALSPMNFKAAYNGTYPYPHSFS